MKFRNDFVTNSSSSSFVINKEKLNGRQIDLIRKHSEVGEKEFGIPYAEWGWSIEETDHFISGYTDIDNFDMYEFLQKIDVQEDDVKWSEFGFNLQRLEKKLVKNENQN